MRGPSVEEIDRLNKEAGRPLPGRPLDPAKVEPEIIPIPAPAKPLILVTPDQSDELPQSIIVHAHPGDDSTKEGVDIAIRRFYEVAKRWAPDAEDRFVQVAGGTPKGSGEGERLKERFVWKRDNNKEYSIPDFIIKDKKTGWELYYNTGKMLKSGEKFIASERRQLDRLKINSPVTAIADALMKLRPGMSKEEVSQTLKKQLEESLERYFRGLPPGVR